nr:unnamed protein product [Callosobruchus chinensis]
MDAEGVSVSDCNEGSRKRKQNITKSKKQRFISLKRLHTITKNMMSGKDIQENRGGDRRSAKNLTKRNNVIQFIGKLKAKESHYNRKKSRRLYLPANLNITRRWKMYNSSTTENLKVKKSFFYTIFRNNFNIGFGSPASDVCSFCFRKKKELTYSEGSNKISIMTELRVHKLRAKQFNLLMKEEVQHSQVFCFDLQQVQDLPKLPIGDAYYLRQLSFYNFCVTDYETQKPIFYTWNETQAGRGANEVASALTNFLSCNVLPDCKVLRLFADGCAGQNKNSYVMYSLAVWLSNAAPTSVEEIRVTFPVRGHSFMPADRVFGRLEKRLRTIEVILNEQEYWSIFSEFGTVKVLGQDWSIEDYKGLDKDLKKLVGIKDMKRIIFKKDKNGLVKIKMEPNYRNDDTSKKFEAITKKGKKLTTIRLNRKELKNQIKKDKINNLKTLLSLYDVNWQLDEKLSFFKEVLENDISQTTVLQPELQDEECDCNEDDGGVVI